MYPFRYNIINQSQTTCAKHTLVNAANLTVNARAFVRTCRHLESANLAAMLTLYLCDKQLHLVGN